MLSKKIKNIVLFDLEKIMSYGFTIDNEMEEILSMFKCSNVGVLSKEEIPVGVVSDDLKIDNKKIIGDIIIFDKYVNLIKDDVEVVSHEIRCRSINKNRFLIERIEFAIVK